MNATPPLFLYNGRDAAGRLQTLRIEAGRIAAPLSQAGDTCVDLRGDRLLPGLINAHDHLQLNGLPRLKFREHYANASEWIADIDPRLDAAPALRAYRAVPRAQRLLLGGLKNLVSGVTTVVHHDPFETALAATDFPVRVPPDFGFAHSLALDGDAAVQAARQRCPHDRPWIIHAGEGTDAAAHAEFDRLDMLGCLRPGTLVVHGLGFDSAQQQRLVRRGAGLVWCPGSNLHLFGRTLDPDALYRQRRLALGSDSRISGEADLLHELALAHRLTRWSGADLEALVTERAAELLALSDRGRLVPGLLADVLVLPAETPLGVARRADVRLVLVGGDARYADPDLASQLGPDAPLDPVEIDGRPKRLWRPLLRTLSLAEPGLRCADVPMECPP